MRKRTDRANDEMRAKWRAKYRANPLNALWANRKYRYGITREDCLERLKMQGGVCPICKQDMSSIPENKWHIDHCHKGGNVRGVLCGSCNINLGFIEKLGHRLLSSMEYLEKASSIGTYSI